VRTVKVDRSTASELDRQLQSLNSIGKQRAFFDFDHDNNEASAWPEEFFWKDSPPGVYVRAKLSEAGSRAIGGKTYRAFSATFDLTRGEPSEVIASDRSGLNLGGLVNDPAFKEILPLWAKNGEPGFRRAGFRSPKLDVLEAEVEELRGKFNAEAESRKSRASQIAILESRLKGARAELARLEAKLSGGAANLTRFGTG
jgi:hypothetical protein